MEENENFGSARSDVGRQGGSENPAPGEVEELGGRSVILVLPLRNQDPVDCIAAIQQVAGTEITGGERAGGEKDQCGIPQDLEGIGSKSQTLSLCGVAKDPERERGSPPVSADGEVEDLKNPQRADPGYHKSSA